MTIKESYNCPNCGAAGTLIGVHMLFEDAKYDMLQCRECGVEWRSYYKTTDVSTEVTSVPEAVLKALAGQNEPAPAVEELLPADQNEENVG